MSVRMKRQESPGAALHRACGKHVAKALAGVQRGSVPGAIHGVRKEIKNLRALVRLARGTVRRKEYWRMAKALRWAARPLAAARDARVAEASFESLVGGRGGAFPGVRTGLRDHTRQADRDFKKLDSAAAAERWLKKVRWRLNGLGWRKIGWSEIRAGLKESYARAREAGRTAGSQPSAEHFHQWRKRVKVLWYQLDFLCGEWPAKTRAWLEGLDKLGAALGKDHDLVLLETFIREQCRASRETTRLAGDIEAHRREQAAGIRRYGAGLFRAAPEAVCGRLEEDWVGWRRRGRRD